MTSAMNPNGLQAWNNALTSAQIRHSENQKPEPVAEEQEQEVDGNQGADGNQEVDGNSAKRDFHIYVEGGTEHHT